MKVKLEGDKNNYKTGENNTDRTGLKEINSEVIKGSSFEIENRNSNQFFENQIVPLWVSTKIAASILGISANALRIRKCRGEIQSKYFGNELRFNVSYLHSLFHDQRKCRKEKVCRLEESKRTANLSMRS